MLSSSNSDYNNDLHSGRDRTRTCDLLSVNHVGWPKLLTIKRVFSRFGRPKRPRRRLNRPL
jgi:hypothetical protein